MQHYDIAVIGAGLVGAAVAFDLHQAGYRVGVFEASHTVCGGVSCTNSGMLHTGFDSEPGTIETRCIRRQAERWPGIFERLGIPYQRQGALLLAKNAEEADKLLTVQEQANQNGVEVEVLNQKETLARSGGAQAEAGLLVSDEAITDPYWVVWSLLGGIPVRLGSRVAELEPTPEGLRFRAGMELITARFVVNCAGLFADEISPGEIRITPRRGEFVVYPKGSASLLPHILLPMPSKFTKGVLLFPTLYGHLCAGPTAVDEEDKTDWAPRSAATRQLHHQSARLVPALGELKPSDAWAGLRPVGHPNNYFIQFSQQFPNLLHLAGIRSTGLSACLGISEYALGLLHGRGLKATQSPRSLVQKPRRQLENLPWWERHNINHGTQSRP
jgi:glycerol-3-phosphate dehydrogenase